MKFVNEIKNSLDILICFFHLSLCSCLSSWFQKKRFDKAAGVFGPRDDSLAFLATF